MNALIAIRFAPANQTQSQQLPVVEGDRPRRPSLSFFAGAGDGGRKVTAAVLFRYNRATN
jgi:hypothetical protein